MTATGTLRGHPMYEDGDGVWRFSDTGEPTVETWHRRPCGVCGEYQTPEGHDPCLGTLPGVRNACCGHGERDSAYIQFDNGMVVRGFDVIYAGDTSEWCDEEEI